MIALHVSAMICDCKKLKALNCDQHASHNNIIGAKKNVPVIICDG